MAAGMGLQRVASPEERSGRKIEFFAYATWGIALVLGLSALWSASYGHDGSLSRIAAYVEGGDRYSQLDAFDSTTALGAVVRSLVRSALILLLLGGLLFAFAKMKAISHELFFAGSLILAGFDLWHFGARYLVTFNPQDSYIDRDLKAFLEQDPESFRIATPIPSLLNRGMLEGIDDVGGYDSIVLKNYSEFINVSQRLPIDEPNLNMTIRGFSPLLNLLNARYFIVRPNTRIQHPGFDAVFQNHKYKVYRNLNALPRSFVVHDAAVIRERDAVFRQLTSAAFDTGARAVVEEEVPDLPHDSTLRSPFPTRMRRSVNRVVLAAELGAPGLLVLSDVYYPGWKAFVDGRETKVLRANYVMRAVVLPPGKHVVEFRYDPLSFTIGAVVTVLSFAGFVVWLAWAALRKAKS
jgi:hypothetical protein